MRITPIILTLTLLAAAPAQAILPWQVSPSHVAFCAPFCNEVDVNYPGYVHGLATVTHSVNEGNGDAGIQSNAGAVHDYDSSTTQQETQVYAPIAQTNASVSRSAYYGCHDSPWELSCNDEAQEDFAACVMQECHSAAYTMTERDTDDQAGPTGYQYRDATLTVDDITLTHHDEWVNYFDVQRSCRDVEMAGPLAFEVYDCQWEETSGSPTQVDEGRETRVGSDAGPISARVDWYPSSTDVSVNGNTTTVPV